MRQVFEYVIQFLFTLCDYVGEKHSRVSQFSVRYWTGKQVALTSSFSAAQIICVPTENKIVRIVNSIEKNLLILVQFSFQICPRFHADW